MVEYCPTGEIFTRPKDPRTEEYISGQRAGRVIFMPIYGILSTSFPIQLNQSVAA
jgi:hypothetical protein